MMEWNAYHFTGAKLRDGRPVPPIGETLVHDGEIVWCKSGLYASRHVLDALNNAPGARLHRVLCEDVEREEGTKFVCRRRTIVATIYATDVLRRFARRCALDVVDLWDAPDVVVRYLKSGDEELRTAAGAAARAARVAAWAARNAAWAAGATGAAGEAAGDAAWTARNAAWAAGNAAGAAGEAAGDAAWAAHSFTVRAARAAAQRRRLAAMVSAEFRRMT